MEKNNINNVFDWISFIVGDIDITDDEEVKKYKQDVANYTKLVSHYTNKTNKPIKKIKKEDK